MRAAYEESKILLAREEIEEVVANENVSDEYREKLQLVLDARAFAIQIGLNAGESFTQYTEVSKDVLAYVLLACKKDAFEPYTWWYPIVGTVPYKGFFEKEDAECDIERLEARGYETWLRGTPAFSTLGWFNDPVLSTTLRNRPANIVNTVIHEIFHQTIWVPGSVDFNESLANFVGSIGAIQFFEERLAECKNTAAEQCRVLEEHLMIAKVGWEFEKELSATLNPLVDALTELYRSEKSFQEKVTLRDAIFDEQVTPLRTRYPKMKILKSLNNAEILQLYLYRKELTAFEAVWDGCSAKWDCFLERMKAIAESGEGAPFMLLKQQSES